MPQGKVIKVIKKASNDILLESESAKTQEKKTVKMAVNWSRHPHYGFLLPFL